MKKQSYILAILFFFTLVTSLALPKETKAIPAFARQTGMACSTCHFQHFPALNAFGRYFKAGGYTMVGGQSMVEGDMLSLPSTLNASIVLKLRYQKTNGDEDSSGAKTETNKGELQFPDEAALFLWEGEGPVLRAQIGGNGQSPDMAQRSSFSPRARDSLISFRPFPSFPDRCPSRAWRL